ncbi:MAG TPA: hypothetical protein VM845_11875 [Burkholderiaceae bacterium]|jgi:hypothetical protein|nr:hypothetical protein [Burkholderiaceae bacterium]
MMRVSLSDFWRTVARSAWRGWMLWVLVLALSMLSFYVHLWRVSFDRGEAALAADTAQVLATKGKARQGTRHR